MFQWFTNRNKYKQITNTICYDIMNTLKTCECEWK